MPRTRATATAVSVPGAAEVVVATLPGISLQGSNPVDIVGEVDITAGLGVTGCVVNVRRGTGITGTLVQGVGPVPPAASARGVIPIECVDTQAADISGQQYVITITQQGATGAGTVNYGEIRADWTSSGTV